MAIIIFKANGAVATVNESSSRVVLAEYSIIQIV